MKYKIIIEAIIDVGDHDINLLPRDCQPRGIAENYANMAIEYSRIGAEQSTVISVEEIPENEDNSC